MTFLQDENSVGAAASILRRALRADPFYCAITVDFDNREDARNETLQSYFEFSIEEAARCGDRLHISLRAVAIWRTNLDPDVAEASTERKHQRLLSVLGPSGRTNYRKMVHALREATPTTLGPEDWYLSILGVAPEHQGEGLGRTVLRDGLFAADHTKKRCFLETFNERSVPFYEALGFSTVGQGTDAVTHSKFWVMARPAVRP
ncbi:GNAT family N-acetyltransferase [Rhizobium leguminosarum]|uniref:GNAT family N-acetyltransferase n=1 Tax=Rhizobium leguminosarum TaxID=384 RepID=UPI001C908967|nr:GNAT family N-acetyltransferase [Rhizobium leguminosarum]MBY2907689.1 GNAT family N-acetyltransferase [Rhizobium leguminosarum]